jgi:hypothetical protein
LTPTTTAEDDVQLADCDAAGWLAPAAATPILAGVEALDVHDGRAAVANAAPISSISRRCIVAILLSY